MRSSGRLTKGSWIESANQDWNALYESLLQLSDCIMESDASLTISRNAHSFTIGHDNDVRNLLKCKKNLLPVLRPLPRNLYQLELVESQVK